MTASSNRDESVTVSDQLNHIAATESDVPAAASERDAITELAISLLQRQHDRINELYYEVGLSDVEAEAVALADVGVTPGGIALIMSVTGREGVSEQTIEEYVRQHGNDRY